MEERDNLLLLGISFEKLEEYDAAVNIYKKYIITHEFYPSYKSLESARSIEREINNIRNFEDAIRYNKHLTNLKILEAKLTYDEFRKLDHLLRNESEIIRKVNS